MAIEYELKFRATPEILAEVDKAFSCPGAQIQMQTTYYDTPSGALSAKRYTLRKRLENGLAVCTLKAPAGCARDEWEVMCSTIESAVPLLIKAGCPQELSELAKEGFIPLCSARFTRIAKTVTLSDGVVELALDQGTLEGGGRTAPLCELEVELKEGSQETCDAFAGDLAARFGLLPEEKSKFKRALMLYKGE